MISKDRGEQSTHRATGVRDGTSVGVYPTIGTERSNSNVVGVVVMAAILVPFQLAVMHRHLALVEDSWNGTSRAALQPRG